ncbi:Hypothetical predicted protein [Podarcis lilfordi]|uniref:Uncharacterized protein n=1 Tax=Podarcis lilfordi TaxID=74358 RepID=A0AA35K4W4_9SAUR|nr:Hypothetical predicted protein [Podarcis lilfordi]
MRQPTHLPLSSREDSQGSRLFPTDRVAAFLGGGEGGGISFGLHVLFPSVSPPCLIGQHLISSLDQKTLSRAASRQRPAVSPAKHPLPSPAERSPHHPRATPCVVSRKSRLLIPCGRVSLCKVWAECSVAESRSPSGLPHMPWISGSLGPWRVQLTQDRLGGK